MLARWICLAATAAGLLLIGLIKPAYNWDVIGYVASAYHQDGLRGAALSHQTYGDLRQAVSPAKFKSLVEDDPLAKPGPGFRFLPSTNYKSTVFRDPKALEQHVPLYAIRIAYVESLRGLKAVGLGYVRSSYLISALCAAAAVVVLSQLLATAGGPPLISALALPAIAVVTGLAELARESNPDAMANLLALLTLLLLLKRSPWALVAAALLPLVRTDFVLLSVLVTGYAFWQGRRWASAAALVAALALEILADRLAGGYGWLTIFNFTLIRLTPYPADLVPSRATADYLRPYGVMVLDLIKSPHVLIYAAAIVVLYLKRGLMKSAGFAPLVVLCLLFVAAHLVLFPAYMGRFFVFAAAFALVWIVGALPRRDARAISG